MWCWKSSHCSHCTRKIEIDVMQKYRKFALKIGEIVPGCGFPDSKDEENWTFWPHSASSERVRVSNDSFTL